jgi:enoyl-CoA hydratase/carnithine racemase
MKAQQIRAEQAELAGKISKLKERQKALGQKAREHMADLAAEAGLLDINVSDEDLMTGFKEMAARFRKADTNAVAKQTGGPVAPDRPAGKNQGAAAGGNG